MPYRTNTDLPVSVRHHLPDLTELPGIGENLAHKPRWQELPELRRPSKRRG